MVRCVECGMVMESGMRYCPKCDAYIYAGNDLKILRIDVAHQGESVEEAVRKLNDAIGRATRENHRKLRVVVGTGLIRDEVGRRLWLYQSQGRLKSYGFEGRNDGAFLVKIM